MKKFCFLYILIAVMFFSACSNNGTDGQPPYRVHLEIVAGSNPAYANAHVYDSKGAFIRTADVKIDGISVVIQSSSNNYYASLGTVWSSGSVHQYSITTPDGVNETGTISKPVGSLTGVTYSPLHTISTIYTVSPPAGQWPPGSYIRCSVVNNGNYGYTRFPSGTADEIFAESRFSGATSISFYSALMNQIQLPKFLSGSYVRVIGDQTSW